jgi:hypothetical protein
MNTGLHGFASLCAAAAFAVAAQTAHAGGGAEHSTPIVRNAGEAGISWTPCPDVFPAGCEMAALHGDPAAPNADVFLRIPGNGYRLPMHSHTSAERMILINGEMVVQYAGSDAATLAPGTYAYGPAGVAHEASCESTHDCVLFIAFEEPVDVTTTN